MNKGKRDSFATRHSTLYAILLFRLSIVCYGEAKQL